MTATLRSRAAPELGPDGRRLVVDCRHGTTLVDLVASPRRDVALTERQMIAVAVARHEAEEGCGCALGLDTLTRAPRGGRA